MGREISGSCDARPHPPRTRQTHLTALLSLFGKFSCGLLRGGQMPVARPSKEYPVLCHVHHVKMGLLQILLNSDSEEGQILAYACAEPDCPVRFNILCGYFLLSPDGGTDELQMVPRVRCPSSGWRVHVSRRNQPGEEELSPVGMPAVWRETDERGEPGRLGTIMGHCNSMR